MQSSSPVRQVIIVSKAHLDVGFTESASKVIHDNINWEFGVAIVQARQLRERGGEERFIWTVPSWMIYTALERKQGSELARLEQALGDGDLAWHALPFTTHSELMDPELFAFGLSLSQTLDARFGKQTIAAKMSDVPGHTRGIIPLLAQAGVRLLHIGVNHMSAVPDVPAIFRWRDAATGAEVVTFYGRGYAGDAQLPGAESYLAFRMVGDNMEIPSIPDIQDRYAELHRQFPGATISYGTLAITRARSPRSRLPPYRCWSRKSAIPGRMASAPSRESGAIPRTVAPAPAVVGSRAPAAGHEDRSRFLAKFIAHRRTYLGYFGGGVGCMIPPVNAISIFSACGIRRRFAIARPPGWSSATIWMPPSPPCAAATCTPRRGWRWTR